MSPRLAFALDAAHQAGRLTLRYFQTGTQVDIKDDVSPVTAADREAEKLIRRCIKAKYPGETILGEEEGQTGTAPDRWVIDPIDGTKSFICGVPLYGTLLSHEVDGEPQVAVCYFPALDEMLYAEKGSGAFWNGRPACVSARATFEGATVACGSVATIASRGWIDSFIRLFGPAMAVRTWGDAYGHALVATGRVDAMIDPSVKRWDISAMSLIVREAGGRFTDFSGSEELAEEGLSSNGLLHDALLEAFPA